MKGIAVSQPGVRTKTSNVTKGSVFDGTRHDQNGKNTAIQAYDLRRTDRMSLFVAISSFSARSAKAAK